MIHGRLGRRLFFHDSQRYRWNTCRKKHHQNTERISQKSSQFGSDGLNHRFTLRLVLERREQGPAGRRAQCSAGPRWRSSPAAELLRQPVLVQPCHFSLKSFPAAIKWAKLRPLDRRQISGPLTACGGLDVGTSLDRQSAQLGKVHLFAVHTTNVAGGVNHEFHSRHSCYCGRRRMLRRGRSTSSPSSEDCTPDNCVTTR